MQYEHTILFLLTFQNTRVQPWVFSGIGVAQALVVCVAFCRSLVVLYSFFSFDHCIVGTFIRFQDTIYPFDIFKCVLH